MVVKVKLTKSYEALIDDEDYDKVIAFSWHVKEASNGVYARSYLGSSDPNPTSMQNFIMNVDRTACVDHIDKNPLNNQRDNLRLATQRQNLVAKRSSNSSGYRGVYVVRGKYINSQLRDAEGNNVHLGSFPTLEDAARAYDAAARRMHGEFAVLNFESEE